MKIQTLTYFIFLILFNIVLSRTDNEMFIDYKNTISQDKRLNTPEEKQCIYLQNFFNALPEEELITTELPSLLRKIFTSPDIQLNSFENWSWIIMGKILQHDDSLEIINFQVFKRLTSKLVDKKIKVPENFKENVAKREIDVFQSLYALYTVVIKELKSKMPISSDQKSEEKTLQEIFNKKLHIHKMIEQIQKKYDEFKKEVLKFEKLKEKVQTDMKKLGDKAVLIEEAKDYKKVSNFIDNLEKNFPCPDKEDNMDNHNHEQMKFYVDYNYNDIEAFFDAALNNGGDVLSETLEPLANDIEEKFQTLKKEKKLIDQEQIFISYQKLLTEGNGEDISEKEARKLKYKNDLKDYHSKVKDFIPKLKENILNSVHYTTLKKNERIKYLEGPYNKSLKNLKEYKKKIKEFQKDLKEKIIILRKENLSVYLLEIKLKKSEFIFPNNIFIDLKLELLNVKKSSDQNKEKIEKIEKMEYVIDLIQMKNDILEIISWKLGKILGRLQHMKKNKKCFSLPKISLYIFKMIKTNMIHFEKTFLESFLSVYPNFEKKKKFILYNYMVSNNREYGLKEIEKLDNKTTIEKQDSFIENFTVNFSLLITIIRNKTTFSRNEVSTKIHPMEISKNIFEMINIDYDKYGEGVEEQVMGSVFDKFNKLLFIILPFLNLIPFMNYVLGEIELLIFKGLLYLLKKLISITATKSKLGIESLKKQITYKDFDFEEILKNLDEVIDSEIPKKDLNINFEKLKSIEENYKTKNKGNSFDFESFDSSDNFVFNFELDVFMLSDGEYLLAHEIPNLGITLDVDKRIRII